MSRPCKFKAQAIGAAVRLDNLPANKGIPAVAVSALPEIGGRSEANVRTFCFTPGKPIKGDVLALGQAQTSVTGDKNGASTAHCLVKKASLFGRVSASLVEVNVDRVPNADGYDIVAHDSKLQGLKIDKFAVAVTIDEAPFNQPDPAPQKKTKGAVIPTLSIIKDIKFLKAPPEGVKIDGHTIVWPGLGTIFLGEICGDPKYGQITMIRVELEGTTGDPTAAATAAKAMMAKGDGGGGTGTVGTAGNGTT